ncbi:PorP/SprF family type IX secretion system membrane protein [Fulvivirga imtechensis]|nr:PorP/SprF family type IX secretion system membrane protein [Fulvivirga imtechensis]
MKKILILLFVITTQLANAQNTSPIYRQFSHNPYLFNPAFAAIDNQAAIGLVYRKQWANFQDAPTSAGLSLQVPVNQRIILGLNVNTDEQVLMQNNTFKGSFTYVVPLGFDQALRFGISGGFGVNALDLDSEQLNTNDPVIMQAAGNNYYADGNFGVAYISGKFRMGFALTELFQSDPFSTETFNEFSFTNLKNRLYSVSYTFDLSAASSVTLEPWLIYHENQDKLQNYWEAATLVNFNEKLWTGASYNQNRGLALLFGMNIMEKVRFTYSYEFPPANSSITNTSSHELQLSMNFGKKHSPVSKVSVLYNKNKRKRYKTMKRKDLSFLEKQKSIVEKQAEEPSPSSDTVEEPEDEDTLMASEDDTSIDEEGPKQYYVVIGAFELMENAVKYQEFITKKGYQAEILTDTESGYNYVYLTSSQDQEEARNLRNDYRQQPYFRKAWVLEKE